MRHSKLIMMSLLIVLLTELSTSSFFLDNYLTQIISKNKHSAAQFSFALAHNNLAALRFAWKKSKSHSKQWLSLSIKLARTQGEVAYQLAEYYENDPKHAIFWYRSAIRLNYFKASITLAQYYFEQDQLNKATEILAAMPVELPENLSIAANIVKIHIAINQGNIPEVEGIISFHQEQIKKTIIGRLLLTDINRYQLLPKVKPVVEASLLTTSCDNSIQLFATNLEHLKRLDSLLQEFKQQGLNQFVCFPPVRYLPINTLDCNHEQDGAIRCNELNWQQWAHTINTRYVGIMLPKGGANVHLGILYFDAQDNVDVLAHEISHLLGFIDEYPLVANHVKCQASQKTPFSQNISVLNKYYQGEQKVVRSRIMEQLAWAKDIKATTPILQPATRLNSQQSWTLGTPQAYEDEVGIFQAKTCQYSVNSEKNNFSAFKALSQRTKLQYFALDFPELYSLLLQESPTQYVMPSFHYNIALAYFQQSFLQSTPFQQNASKQRRIEQSNDWLEQAANWEQDIKKRKIVRQGKFE